jgi:hypothetical protein
METPRMPKTHGNPHNLRSLLDEIAASIKKLNLYLDSGEIDGKPLTVAETDEIARQLRFHVEQLLMAAKSLRDETSD